MRLEIIKPGTKVRVTQKGASVEEAVVESAILGKASLYNDPMTVLYSISWWVDNHRGTYMVRGDEIDVLEDEGSFLTITEE